MKNNQNNNIMPAGRVGIAEIQNALRVAGISSGRDVEITVSDGKVSIAAKMPHRGNATAHALCRELDPCNHAHFVADGPVTLCYVRQYGRIKVGVAVCSPDDQPMAAVGRAIALERALFGSVRPMDSWLL